MNIIEIMTHKPIVGSANDTLRQTLETMLEHGFKHLPILSKDKHLVGVVSDRDCRLALNSPFLDRANWEQEPLVDSLQVSSIMTSAPITVEPNTLAEDAAKLMLTHRIGCLPVMRDETLVGMVTRSDILMAFINQQTSISESFHS